MPDPLRWTVAQVLEHVGWPLGRRGRTTCPIHKGDNDQSFHYEDERWYCFRCNEGGGVPRLLERLGFPRLPMQTPGHPAPRVPRGTEFATPPKHSWFRERSRRPVFRATLGQVSRLLEYARTDIEARVRWAWEQEHTKALSLYRYAEGKAERLHQLDPENPMVGVAFDIMAECVSRLREAHRHMTPPCPGDCYERDDPRPREDRVDKAQCV